MNGPRKRAPRPRTTEIIREILATELQSAPPAGLSLNQMIGWLRHNHPEAIYELSKAMRHPPSRNRVLKRYGFSGRLGAAVYHLGSSTGILRRELLRIQVRRWQQLGMLPRVSTARPWRTLIFDVGAGTGNLLDCLVDVLSGFDRPVIDYVAIEPDEDRLGLLREGIAPDGRAILGAGLGAVRLLPRPIDHYLSGGLVESLGNLQSLCDLAILHFCDFHQSFTSDSLAPRQIRRTLALHDGLIRELSASLPVIFSLVLTPRFGNLFGTRLLDRVAAAEEQHGRANLVVYPCPSRPDGGAEHGCWKANSWRDDRTARQPGGVESKEDTLCRAPQGSSQHFHVYDLEIEVTQARRVRFRSLTPRLRHELTRPELPVGGALCEIREPESQKKEGAPSERSGSGRHRKGNRAASTQTVSRGRSSATRTPYD